MMVAESAVMLAGLIQALTDSFPVPDGESTDGEGGTRTKRLSAKARPPAIFPCVQVVVPGSRNTPSFLLQVASAAMIPVRSSNGQWAMRPAAIEHPRSQRVGSWLGSGTWVTVPVAGSQESMVHRFLSSMFGSGAA